MESRRCAIKRTLLPAGRTDFVIRFWARSMETTPTSPQRPQGITAIALLLFFAAALMILFVFTLAVTQEPLPDMPELADSGVSLEELRPIFTAALLILGAVFIAAGTGLWQLRNWGRILALVLAGLEVFGQILRVLGAAASASDFSLVTSLLFLGL